MKEALAEKENIIAEQAKELEEKAKELEEKAELIASLQKQLEEKGIKD
jgi:hypothetical protein